ncbi:YqaJ viral recombinase family [Cotonvirus japonicus]|uniref:YqaJ viral recombinase family n=1 Tax=Cotonvirus japonicus TaxID=2811091 RepID=A0ABM7NSZ0_9VIRU|nr:YqaJ viral recombinase family [Cotonvirus japonicus]BCS83221.1 YqaJ viral recombinase family [Cotonvirus japonicus]
MNIAYYNQEIDKILWDALGNDYFIEEDLNDIIDFVSKTIYQYDTKYKLSTLKFIVEFIIKKKYVIHYVYDKNSLFNQFEKPITKPTKKLINNSDDGISDEDNFDYLVINDSDLELSENSKKKSIKLNINCPDKILLTNHLDLISHKYTYDGSKYGDDIYLKRYQTVEFIKTIPQHEQKSKLWLEQRNGCLTATAISVVLDEDPYKHPITILFDKCGRGTPFVENKFVHHGNKYEQIGTMFYSFRNNVEVGEYGLLQHVKKNFIAASPDGICGKNTNDGNLSKLVGRLLEIKFPATRKIETQGDLDGDICPHYYYMQVQTQLFVTQLDECDFLQCKTEEYDSWDEYLNDTHLTMPGLSKTTNLEKGCLIQLLPKKLVSCNDKDKCLYNSKYIYPPRLHMTPEEIEKWISCEIMNYHTHEYSEDYLIDRIIYWRLSQVTCNLIIADVNHFNSKIPLLEQFWQYILFYRENTSKLDKLVEYVKEVGEESSAKIFTKIHKDYSLVNKNSKYEPLYQEETEWRKVYNKKYAYRKKYNYNKPTWQ